MKKAIDAAEALYGKDSAEKVYATELKPGLEKLELETDSTEAQLADYKRATSQLFHELNLDRQASGQWNDRFVSNVVNPPTEEQKLEWARETQARLKELYGTEAKERLRAINEYSAKSPALKTFLNTGGLNGHPKIVLDLAEKAWTLRAKARERKR